MNNFFLIMGNYFKRFFRDYKENMLLLIIPIGLTIVYSLFESPEVVPGYNTQSSFAMVIIMIGFQFFNGGIMLHYLYRDLRGDMKWRLRSTPQELMSFVLPAFVANWLFSVVLGIIIIVISVAFLNAYVGSFLILGLVLLFVSLIASFVAMLIFFLTKKYNAANGLIYVVSFGHFILSGQFFIPLGSGAFAQFMFSYGTPISLGLRAVTYSGAMRNIMFLGPAMREGQDWFNIGILAALAVVLGVITIVVGKVKKI
ncbi:MAG: ABC transporter permease [Oscillospiraceae bacterium]|nr:ABC transporter permease [Oscillospiraceae bacterium]